jgi:hypothetical protein
MTFKFDGPEMDAGVEFYTEHSKMKSNGVRDVPKSAFMERMSEVHGVEKELIEKYHDALDFESTVAGEVSLRDVVAKVVDATAEQLADDEFRRGLKATTRLPTPGGNTDITLSAEVEVNIPARGEQEARTEIRYARTKTKINCERRILREFHEHAGNTIRAALGLPE